MDRSTPPGSGLPEDRDEILLLCESPSCRSPEYAEDFRRLAKDGSDPELQAHARVVCGAEAYRDFRHEEAARLFRDALTVLWGGGTRSERSALVNLAMTCMRLGRTFETLVLGRRAAEAMREHEDAIGEFLAEITLATVYRLMGDGERRLTSLERAEALVGRIPDPPRGTCEGTVAHQRANLALESGDAAAARRFVEALENAAPRRDPRFVPFVRARVLFLEERFEEAVALTEELRATGGPDPAGSFHVARLGLEALLGLGRREEAEKRAWEILDGLSASEPAPLGSGKRLEIAEELGRIATAAELAPGIVHAAFDLAGAAALGRIAELDRFLRALPDLREADEKDRSLLAGYRRRFAREHEEILRAVAEQIRERSGFPGTWTEDVVHVCAWCGRLRAPDGAWAALDGLALPRESFFVSHGICRDCLTAMKDDLA
jgi:tetratricopeptide (TPR) repeat protein